MLRGWDQGFAVSSLGIATHAAARGIGLGRALMLYLHAEARRRGARRIRLKVYPDNRVAVELYRTLGYVFAGELEEGQLVGPKDWEQGLSQPRHAGSAAPAATTRTDPILSVSWPGTSRIPWR